MVEPVVDFFTDQSNVDLDKLITDTVRRGVLVLAQQLQAFRFELVTNCGLHGEILN
ncbi:protein of unknown function [Limnospira indica PCC 8005]|uniref:Uncharacterized protein n=1 Tax=Limnospira indica PCC 8005 TaxID=376219 RepID=A0A9P1KCS8_9CYAN|nr:protein of unknown function [Limnospira indica PCC 8005]